jgi:hypothetical protein
MLRIESADNIHI